MDTTQELLNTVRNFYTLGAEHAIPIVSYKFSAVSWQLSPAGEFLDDTRTLEERFFTAPTPIEARRQAVAYYMDTLANIKELEQDTGYKPGTGTAPPLAYHLRVYFVMAGEVRSCIYSEENYQNPSGLPMYPVDLLLKALNYEVELYHLNGYDMAPGPGMVTLPDDTKIYKVLEDSIQHWVARLPPE